MIFLKILHCSDFNHLLFIYNCTQFLPERWCEPFKNIFLTTTGGLYLWHYIIVPKGLFFFIFWQYCIKITALSVKLHSLSTINLQNGFCLTIICFRQEHIHLFLWKVQRIIQNELKLVLCHNSNMSNDKDEIWLANSVISQFLNQAQ